MAPPDPVAGIERCRSITAADARLACFDAAASALASARASGEVQLVNRRELREARRGLFGFALPKLPFFRGDDTQDEASSRLDSRITSARGLGYGKYRITIADGDAVWETTESYSTLEPPQAGQPISIRKGPLGSYMVRINNQRGVKGRRVG